jgi:excisionase family DNA binding protein
MRPDANSTRPNLLLTARETAEALRISLRTLWALTAPRGALPAVRIGRRVFYRLQDVDQFIQNQLVKPMEAKTYGNPDSENGTK